MFLSVLFKYQFDPKGLGQKMAIVYVSSAQLSVSALRFNPENSKHVCFSSVQLKYHFDRKGLGQKIAKNYVFFMFSSSISLTLTG